MRALVVACLLLPAALAGCSGGAQEPQGPTWVEVVVPARHMLDLRYELASGTALEWTWEIAEGRPVPFEVVYINEEGRSQRMAPAYSSTSQGQITTPAAGQYHLVWDNLASSEFTVRFVASDGYAQRLWPPGQGPGCAPVTMLGQVC